MDKARRPREKNTTFAVILNSRPNRFGKYAVYIRITQDRKVTKKKTAVEVAKKDFNSNGGKNNNWIRPSDPESKSKNNLLSSELDKVRGAFFKLKSESSTLPTASEILSSMANDSQGSSFIEFAHERTQQIYDAGGIRNWKCYVGFMNKLVDFLRIKMNNKKDLMFSEITPAFLSKFQSYLDNLNNSRSKNDSKKLSDTTKAAVFKVFKSLMKRAEELQIIDKNPFISFKYEKGDAEPKKKLDLAEIEALGALELKEGTLDWHSRNCFLFSFYCAGIRAGDLLLLRWKNVEGGRLVYQMGKNHKTRDLKLEPQATAILDLYRKQDAKPTDYIFPFMNSHKVYSDAVELSDRDKLPSDIKQKMFQDISSKNALINKSLKRLAVKAGIDKKVSMHISRHSFANIAVKKGVESNKVKSVLAHSNLKTTEAYMGEFSTKETDEVMDKVFGGTDKKAQLEELLKSMSKEDVSSVLKAMNF